MSERWVAVGGGGRGRLTVEQWVWSALSPAAIKRGHCVTAWGHYVEIGLIISPSIFQSGQYADSVAICGWSPLISVVISDSCVHVHDSTWILLRYMVCIKARYPYDVITKRMEAMIVWLSLPSICSFTENSRRFSDPRESQCALISLPKLLTRRAKYLLLFSHNSTNIHLDYTGKSLGTELWLNSSYRQFVCINTMRNGSRGATRALVNRVI